MESGVKKMLHSQLSTLFQIGEIDLKKIFLVFSAVTIMLFCTSCSENVRIPSVNTAVEENVSVNIGDTEYRCHISYVSDTTAAVTFSAPESLKDMTFRKTADGFSVSLGTLICKSGDFSFSESCVFRQITDELAKIKQDNIKFMSKQGDKYMFSLKSDPTCKFLTDENGHIISFTGKDIKIKFNT